MDAAWWDLVLVAAGGALALGGAWANEIWRRRRERATRWLPDRRALYADVLNAAAHVQAVASNLVNASEPSREVRDLEVAIDRVDTLIGGLHLLAPSRVVDLGDGLRDWAIDVGITVRNHLQNNDQNTGFREMKGAGWVLRRDLLEAMREDLELPLAGETLLHVFARRQPIPVYHPDARKR